MTPNKSDSGELRASVRQIINDRPYYICKSPGNHSDLQSQLGSIDGQYRREHDEANEKYLEDALTSLVTAHIQAVGEEIIGDGELHVSHVCPPDNPGCIAFAARGRMRNAQRQRLAQYLGKDKK